MSKYFYIFSFGFSKGTGIYECSDIPVDVDTNGERLHDHQRAP